MSDNQVDLRTKAVLERLAKKLGGGWRIEHGVMPLIVLTLPEAQRLEEKLEARCTSQS